MTENNVTLIVAIISAAATVYGYFYSKQRDREFTLETTRREIYQKLITNLYQRTTLIRDAYLKEPQIFALPVEQLYAAIAARHPALSKNITAGLEINALLCIYGTDPAVKKAAAYSLEGAKFAQHLTTTPPDFPSLVLTLRQSIYGKSHDSQSTTVTTAEIGQLLTA